MKKKILTLLMAAVLATSMPVTAFAAGNYSIKIEQVEKATEVHTYEAYQIFKGDLSADGTTLSNITWGDNISLPIEFNNVSYGDDDAAKLAEVLKEESDAEALAKAVAEHIKGEPKASATETSVGAGVTLSGLEDGYYFVKDKDGSLSGDADSYSRYMIQIAGENVSVTAKADVPSTEKKLKDTNDTTGEVTGWQDSADYDIGDVIPFQFSSTIVENISKYVEPYIYTFHDVESAGLTFNTDSVKVTIAGNEYTDFKVNTSTSDGCTFEIITGDLRNVAKAGDKIVVEYTSTLNEKAIIGNKGNKNEMHLEFSNNPNGEGTGNTPVDTVIVFTYKVVINKVTMENNKTIPLEGAKFTLSKLVGATYKVVKELEATPIKDNDGNVVSYTFSFEGIDDGQYKLEETQTPDGYNTMEPVEFNVVADHRNDKDESPLTLQDLNGNKIEGSIDLGFATSVEDGSLTADVINNKGSLLPSTGGMGTTIFYVLGGILVIGAGVVLFARKRMSVEE